MKGSLPSDKLADNAICRSPRLINYYYGRTVGTFIGTAFELFIIYADLADLVVFGSPGSVAVMMRYSRRPVTVNPFTSYPILITDVAMELKLNTIASYLQHCRGG